MIKDASILYCVLLLEQQILIFHISYLILGSYRIRYLYLISHDDKIFIFIRDHINDISLLLQFYVDIGSIIDGLNVISSPNCSNSYFNLPRASLSRKCGHSLYRPLSSGFRWRQLHLVLKDSFRLIQSNLNRS